MLHGYCGVLDPIIDNINAQPRVLMNSMKNKLEDNWEYVKYDLSFHEFKAQVNVYLKNRQHSLKLFIESNSVRPRIVLRSIRIKFGFNNWSMHL
jgi:hypothetical protein